MKYIIFDLDGTLIDTESDILKTWQITLAEYGYDFSMEALRCVLGVPNAAGLQRLHANVDNCFDKRWQEHYAPLATNTRFFPGVLEMLQNLKKEGYSLGAVSSRCWSEYNTYFSGLGLSAYFDAIVLEEDTIKHKPDPEPLHKYMELMNAPKEQCIYIGDMPSDIACANSAGISSGLVTWNGANVHCDHADYYFTSPAEVLNV